MAPCLFAEICIYVLESLYFFLYLGSDEATLSQVISNVSTQELVCRLTYLNLISWNQNKYSW